MAARSNLEKDFEDLAQATGRVMASLDLMDSNTRNEDLSGAFQEISQILVCRGFYGQAASAANSAVVAIRESKVPEAVEKAALNILEIAAAVHKAHNLFLNNDTAADILGGFGALASGANVLSYNTEKRLAEDYKKYADALILIGKSSVVESLTAEIIDDTQDENSEIRFAALSTLRKLERQRAPIKEATT